MSNRYELDRINYFLSQIKPLDCIFFQGNEIVSTLIVTLEKYTMGKGDWSHVGIVVNKHLMPNLRTPRKEDPHTLYLWESTISSRNTIISQDPTLDIESDEPVFGVQIRNLRSVLENGMKNKVKMGWGMLISNPSIKLSRELDNPPKDFVESDRDFQSRFLSIRNKLNLLHLQNYHRDYEKNLCRLLSAMFACGKCSTCSGKCCRSSCCVGENWRFCSQLVTIIYKEIGVLDKSIDDETVLPQDLATPSLSQEKIPKILQDVVIIS